MIRNEMIGNEISNSTMIISYCCQGIDLLTRVGSKDNSVPPYQMKRFSRVFKELGGSVVFKEFKDKEHWWWDSMETNGILHSSIHPIHSNLGFQGIYGGLFIKMNLFIAKLRKGTLIRQYPVIEVAAIAILTALINYPNIFMQVQASELQFCDCRNSILLHVSKSLTWL